MNKELKTEKLRFFIAVSFAVLLVSAMWIVKFFELSLHEDYSYLGIIPRTFGGLKGVFFSPFLHGSLGHLYSNTFPFLILTAALLYFFPQKGFLRFAVLFFGSTFLLWITGREGVHIGASGVIYSLAAYIFFVGVLTRKSNYMAVSLIVIFLYGSLIWGMFPTGDKKISWEGHLSGFIVGTLTALLWHPHEKTEKLRFKENISIAYAYNFMAFSSKSKVFLEYKFVDNRNNDTIKFYYDAKNVFYTGIAYYHTFSSASTTSIF